MARSDKDADDTIIDPMDTFFDTNFGPTPVAPDGQFIPATAVYESEEILPATEEYFICLRGPCRYYLEQIPYFDAGNTKGTLDHRPVLIKRTCMRITAFEIDLTDEIMKDCIAWDPLLNDDPEVIARNARREKYYQIRNAKKES